MADLIRENWTGRRFYKILRTESIKEAKSKVSSRSNRHICSSEGTINGNNFLVEIIIRSTKNEGQDCK